MEPIACEELDRMNSTKRNEHAQAVIEAAGCRIFDWAYPIDWWRQFIKKTSFRHCNGEIVWGYSSEMIFGRPIALTIRAKKALEKDNA